MEFLPNTQQDFSVDKIILIFIWKGKGTRIIEMGWKCWSPKIYIRNLWIWLYSVKGSLQIWLSYGSWDHPELSEWTLNVMTTVLKRDDKNTKDKACEDGGKDWSYAVTSQRTPGATRSWKRKGSILHYHSWREGNPTPLQVTSRTVRE